MEVCDNKVVIIGAGLVGCLSSIYFSNNGWDVELYERKPNDQTKNASSISKRSINLAISKRGLLALKEVGFKTEEFVKDNTVSMKGRLIHGLSGATNVQLYGTSSQNIYSIDRENLNNTLIKMILKNSNISLKFDHKLVKLDPKAKTCCFETNNTKIEAGYSFLVGSDGAYSAVRSQIMKFSRINFSQEYIDHGYCELTIPPKTDSQGKKFYAMEPNYLHIWPRGSYMMIALPNLDYSFTCTLFMPYKEFERIDNEEKLLEFFNESLKDSIELIGEQNLVNEYFSNPKGSLMSIVTNPTDYRGEIFLVGDAAHCMVPFYGQGMNAGFEDVYKLFEYFKLNKITPNTPIDCTKKAVQEFCRIRQKETEAICFLAMQNYIEMRSSVTSFRYLVKRRIARFLHFLFPKSFIPLYTMVSFTDIPYNEVITRNSNQDRLINLLLIVFSSAVISSAAVAALKYRSFLTSALNK